MKPKSVLPLPSYTLRKWLKARRCWAYYFSPPSWALKPEPDDDRGECPVGAEALGSDYDAAVQRVEKVLLPLFHSWRTKGLTDIVPAGGSAVGTLDWLFQQYRDSDKFKKLSRGQRALHEAGFAMVGQYVMTNGARLGTQPLSAIDTGVADRLYEKLLPLRDQKGEPVPLTDQDGAGVRDKHGQPVFVERRTSINHAMKSCRRAWNVAFRLNRKIVPESNPFAKMGLVSSHGAVTEASYPELTAALACADARGLKSLAAALLVTWEWLQREEHIFTAFKLDHYRPKERPDEVKIVHPKTGAEVWVPLFDRAKGGAPVALFPELMARMDALKHHRIGNGLFFVRDWCDANARAPLPWATETGRIDLVRKKIKAVIRAAGVREELSFTSFRHGGFTELGDAELTDAQIRALSRQKSSKIVGGYVKRTQVQIIAGTHKRRAGRRSAEAPPADPQLSFDALLAKAKGDGR